MKKKTKAIKKKLAPKKTVKKATKKKVVKKTTKKKVVKKKVVLKREVDLDALRMDQFIDINDKITDFLINSMNSLKKEKYDLLTDEDIAVSVFHTMGSVLAYHYDDAGIIEFAVDALIAGSKSQRVYEENKDK